MARKKEYLSTILRVLYKNRLNDALSVDNIIDQICILKTNIPVRGTVISSLKILKSQDFVELYRVLKPQSNMMLFNANITEKGIAKVETDYLNHAQGELVGHITSICGSFSCDPCPKKGKTCSNQKLAQIYDLFPQTSKKKRRQLARIFSKTNDTRELNQFHSYLTLYLFIHSNWPRFSKNKAETKKLRKAMEILTGELMDNSNITETYKFPNESEPCIFVP